ncbi:hypothetical protein [Actinophytocola sp.]|uniref:hypothetical protein n=1 Tax=Actinophytocola sp. TaxID=1872138 RepID=UPI002ED3B4D6
MKTTDLGELMRAATDDLETTPDFARQVILGGRRRKQRRRVMVAAGALAVIAAIGSTTIMTLGDGPTISAADERLEAPTMGDLAGDQAFLNEVVAAWREGLPLAPEAALGFYNAPQGDPHVYWAGNTPAGRAAIVLQQVQVPDNGQIPTGKTGTRTAEGLVAIDAEDGKLKLVGTRPASLELLGWSSFYKFGDGTRTMLIVDEGKPLYYSFEFSGAKERPKWHRAESRDGVALVSIPKDANERGAVAYQGDQPPAVVDWKRVPYDFYAERMTFADEYLAKRLTEHPTFRTSLLPWQEAWVIGQHRELQSPADRDLLRARGVPQFIGSNYVSVWAIFAGLDDGRTVVLEETQSPTGTPQLIAFLLTSDGVNLSSADGGPVDRNAVLPVKFRIPEGGGWIVAQQGQTLSYRTSPNGQWQDAGKDAALLPDNAVEVKVGEEIVQL